MDTINIDPEKERSYCIKCRDYTHMIDPRIDYTQKNNRKQLIAECPICGITKRKFIK